MASPIVCVAKKNGGVRLAVDYRYLNSFTIADAYPMTTVNEILRKMGSANLFPWMFVHVCRVVWIISRVWILPSIVYFSRVLFC